MKPTFSLFVLASLLLTFTDAALKGEWPTVDKPPPPVAKWTALVDQSKVPKAPQLKTTGGASCKDNDEFCNWTCTTCTRNDSDIVKCPTKGDWGITFDDGPTEFTDALLDFLETKNVKVTFFVIGSRVIERPEILKKAVDHGHQIGIHTWSHPLLTTQSTEEIIAELKWTELAIKTAVGLSPKYMRPPFGDYDDRVRGIAAQLGYKIVIWDFDTNDWMSGDEQFKNTFQLTWIEGNFTEWVKEPSTTGHVSLEHDLYKPSAERAQLSIPIVQNAGFLIKPVAVCMGDNQPYVENFSLGNSTTPTTVPKTTPTSPMASNTNVAPAAQSSSSAATTDSTINNASTLNNINLWSISILIVGSFIFI